ncbi:MULTISPECIES: hypothetical protein [unclassified Microcoleus]|uniref:hypothetical protein n=1 Tax=unclassified Microcoleus TaxID=2642155 RepID=UPI002FD3BC09
MDCILEKSSIYPRVMKDRCVPTAGAVAITLTESEEQAFQEELGRIEPEAQEQVMQIVTSWVQTGIERGRREGIQEGIRLGKVSLVMRLLHRRRRKEKQP